MASVPGVIRPSPAWFAVLDGGIAALSVLAADERAHAAVRARVPIPDQAALRRLLAGTAVIHVGEALWAARVARRHDLPGGRWALQTAVVGFPSLFALRRATAAG